MNRFYKYLYWDERIPEKKRRRIKRQLRICGWNKPWYVVIALHEGSDQLDIYRTWVFWQPYFKKNPKYIIGIAADYAGALGIVRQIAAECYEKNKDADLKKYLAERARA